MIVIYHCFGGNHTSVTAAHIHLGHLPRNSRPAIGEIMAQPYFDRMPSSEIGQPLYMGEDERGQGIYCLGLGTGKDRLRQALEDFLRHLGVPGGTVAFVAALPAANWWMKVGGFLSRVLGVVWPGRHLVALGAWLSYPELVRVADQGRRGAAQPAEP